MTGKKKNRKVNAKGRNGTEQWVPISYVMVRSPAWRSLSGPAVKVWVEIRSRFNGWNNGDLSVSLDEASRLLGMGKATAKRAFAELEEKGFLKMTKLGQWYGRMATTWAITDRSLKGNLASNDWKHWRPPPKRQKTSSRFSGGTYLFADGSATEPKDKNMVRSRTRQTIN